jgi:hypothetical protein
MLSNERSQYNDKEIVEKGSRALIKELGYSGFLRYIRQKLNMLFIHLCNLKPVLLSISIREQVFLLYNKKHTNYEC